MKNKIMTIWVLIAVGISYIILASIYLVGCDERPGTGIGWAEESDFEEIFEEESDLPNETPLLMSPPSVSKRSHRPPEGSAARAFYDRLVYIMGNLRDTYYVHYSDKYMNEDDGIYKYDCSGFVSEFILKVALPEHYNDLVQNAKRFHDASSRRESPRAWGFYDYFNEILNGMAENKNNYWYVFKSFDNVRPGDIIVAKYDEEWRRKQIEKHGSASTGHVMVAWSFPVHSSCADNEYWIYVIDSSNSGHAKDTRRTEYDNVNDEKGIGKGQMWFGIETKNDKEGNKYEDPIFYRWSKSKCRKGCKYTLVTDETNCTKNRERYERLEGIIMARPIYSTQ